MTGRVVSPSEAVSALREKVSTRWADAVCAEHDASADVGLRVSLRPGVRDSAAVERLGFDVWTTWTTTWRAFAAGLPGGVRVGTRPVKVRGVESDAPAELAADGLDAACRIVGDDVVDVPRARDLARSLADAGADLRPALLRRVYDLAPADATMLLTAVAWLSDTPDTGAATARRLRIPGLHTKWIEKNARLLKQATGRDLLAEVTARPAVVHLTYTDPDHLARRRRRHDAWTTGDVHDLAYRPRVVLVVENRDSRLFFPECPHTIVVEGGGKAAAATLAGIPWIRAAEHVVYWGDMDADGYAILDRFRAAMAAPADGMPPRTVRSILMDSTDLHRYADFGVGTDTNGAPLTPSTARLNHLTPGESAAYDAIATAGDAPFRRIEQELVPLPEAARRLLALTASG